MNPYEQVLARYQRSPNLCPNETYPLLGQEAWVVLVLKLGAANYTTGYDGTTDAAQYVVNELVQNFGVSEPVKKMVEAWNSRSKYITIPK